MLRQMPLPQPEGVDELDTLSIRTSHPRWLVEAFVRRLGPGGAQALLEADNWVPPITAQVNLLRTTPEALAERLEGEGVSVQPHPWLPGCLLLSETGNLEGLPSFREGLFYIQDCAARLAITAAGLEPGMRVLDCCAAPGGKSFAAAIDLEDRGEVVCCDIHPHKITLMEAGKERLGPPACSPGRAEGAAGVGRPVRRGHRGRALLGAGDHPEEAGHPLQGPGSPGRAARDPGADPGLQR